MPTIFASSSLPEHEGEGKAESEQRKTEDGEHPGERPASAGWCVPVPLDAPITQSQLPALQPDWHRSLAAALRNPDELITRLNLPDDLREPARRATELFPLLVPESYLARMRPGDACDPLLLQVMPLGREFDPVPGFITDAVGDEAARRAPGLLHKYQGRALFVTTGACAVHCRYCFRRHYPYHEEPRRLDDWQPAFEVLERDTSIHEIILSGGDPWMLTDTRLREICQRLADIPHITRLRFHTRLPIVLPERVTDDLLSLLTSLRPTPIVVVHANHPAEVVADCAQSLRRLVRAGVTVLNQSVLLKGVNDSSDILASLSERLVNLGVMPYYIHQLDRVAGAAHFEVPVDVGKRIITELRTRLPGYGVPQFVQEIAGEASKIPLV